MTQPIEGVLNQSHIDSLEIVDFIFHIIDPEAEEGDEVVHLDEVQLQPQQTNFFIQRLRDAAKGTQYVFLPDAVDLKSKCETILDDPTRFVEMSRQITNSFSGRHGGRTSAGVFVISRVRYLSSPANWNHLIFLIKMDKGASFSYSYTEQDGKRIAVLMENENALIETKNSIQKSALVDISGVFAWDILAYDRIQKPLIGDYFRNFLGATQREVDSVLTRKAHLAVKKWASTLSSEDMPDDEDAHGYTGRSFRYLGDHTAFDTDEYLNSVIRDEDDERKALLTAALREELAKAGVAGQQFSPKPGSLKTREKKQVYQTAEGVIVSFQGDKETVGITKERAGNGERLIIETASITVK